MSEIPPISHSYMDSATFFKTTRIYVTFWALLVAGFTWGATAIIQGDQSRYAGTVQANVLESSRPLDEVSKAPADWTGDGKADGWAFGEYLPGDTVTVYLDREGKSYVPTHVAEYIIFGSLAAITVLAFGILVGYMALDMVRYKTSKAAAEDWVKAHGGTAKDMKNWFYRY